MSSNEEASEDPRTPEQKRDDWICDQLISLTSLVRAMAEQAARTQNVQKVIHKTEGASYASIIAACVSVSCVVLVIVITVIVMLDVHDLRAWKDVHSNDIAALKADVKQLKGGNGK